eukprot:m.21398 g.21398  ORF g.21398 m.21398 type:complete len:109 (-) comp7134_c0_seq2:96-422(-)
MIIQEIEGRVVLLQPFFGRILVDEKTQIRSRHHLYHWEEDPHAQPEVAFKISSLIFSFKPLQTWKQIYQVLPCLYLAAALIPKPLTWWNNGISQFNLWASPENSYIQY